jgi:hypothetical protein
VAARANGCQRRATAQGLSSKARFPDCIKSEPSNNLGVGSYALGDDVDGVAADSVNNNVRESADGQLTGAGPDWSRRPNLCVPFDEVEGVGNRIEQTSAPARPARFIPAHGFGEIQ